MTVRTPFLPPECWRAPVLSLLERFLPIDVTLSHLENRPGGLVLIVEPDDELREITEADGLSWPTLPLHKGNRPDLAYPMTVVRTANNSIRSQAWEALAPHLPLRVIGTEMWASEGSLEDGLRLPLSHGCLQLQPTRTPPKWTCPDRRLARRAVSFLIVAAHADDAAVTAVMGHAIDTTAHLRGDWREAEERNAVGLRQLADAGIGQYRDKSSFFGDAEHEQGVPRV